MDLIIHEATRVIAVAGTADLATIYPESGETWRLMRITYMPDANTVANGTNYATVRAYKGTGTSTPIHAARTTASVDLTLGTKISAAPSTESPDLNFSASGSDLEISQSNPLSIQVSHAGSGAAVKLSVRAEFERLRRMPS